ncbi:major facilitator superfamily domain-containing protein [Pseudomassariella vexata]|uniref:Major facilitator superfamily domain-containing protein n=1 Tax=Pseudomassariella vexata TaxID=1141098 RepID=A0A1Y2DCG0_9PEZI|nr:major facilitator superfamily domain-containing protein [Pseudomassariella vexata]ORY56952.1 major facilitator superfamily domain-containing protein [Pseudomassariella vexata]
MDPEKTSNGQRAGEAPEKYSVFTPAEKWCITAMVAYAASFSTLSSFIYYPVLEQLSQSLAVSIDQINLTITSYMAVATVAPTLLGDAADVLGRRPTYVVALSLYVSYISLVALRVMQALTISGVFSIAYGVVTYIASPAERGSFVGAVSFASTPLASVTIAPSLGPILGGGLAYAAGWTWIFWFLGIAASLCLAIIVCFLPETSRNLVGNGSIRPSKHLQLPIPGLMCHWKESDVVASHRWRLPNPLRSLKILIRKDNIIIILACGILYVVYTCICASLSVLFINIYELNQFQAGLIYMPFGVGGTLSTFFCGPLLNKAYRKARTEHGLATDITAGDDLDKFPIEKARLTVIWIPMLVTTLSVVAFGWVLHFHQVRIVLCSQVPHDSLAHIVQHIAIPLCIQFIAGLAMQLDFSIYNTLLVDKNHRTPAAAQASSKIVRFALAAIATVFLQDLIDTLGIGGTSTLMGGCALLSPACF